MNSSAKQKKYKLLLTGANGGIGSALAAALAAESDTMLLVGHEQAGLDRLKATLTAQNPDLPIELVCCDLGTEEGRQSVVQAAKAARRGINLLINAAGILDFHALSSQDERLIESTIRINLLSPMLLTQKMLPIIQSAGDGQIVNLGSAFGDIGYPGFAAYCASKFGLRGFSQALRRELDGTGVRVRYFAPRATRTPINSSAVNRMNEELKTAMDEPKVVAATFMKFLAGSSAEMVVGWPEKFYVFINKVRHQLTDQAISKQMNVIKKYLPV